MLAAFSHRKTRLAVVAAALCSLYLLFGLVSERRDVLSRFAFVRGGGHGWWSGQKLHHPIPKLTPLPAGRPRTLPRVQHGFEADPSPEGRAREELLEGRRAEVKAALVKSWNSYRNVGFGYDEVRPVSGQGHDVPGFGGWGATLVDSLSTLWIMDLKDEFREAAAAAVAIDYSKSVDTSCNFFETTIRHLGGLLSAHDLSGEPALLRKAVELGDLLYLAYDTPNHMPPFWLDFEDARRGRQTAGRHDPSAAIASQSLEFTRLAQLTGDAKYYDAVNRVAELLDTWQDNTTLPGVWPTFLDMKNLDPSIDNTYTIGALADSLYEYLPKTFAILGGLEPLYEKLYRTAMDTVVKHMLFRPMTPDQADVLFPGSVYVSDSPSSPGPGGATTLTPEVQHLACFAGGMLGLGGRLFALDEHVALGERLARGCVWAYDQMPLGIMPEIATLLACETLEPCAWDEEAWQLDGSRDLARGFKNARDPRYLLRPEAIESVFLLYRITGKAEYQEAAWRMFQAIRNATETDLAFSSILSVTTPDPFKLDSMESFWLAETLRYFYLVFSPPDLIDLDEFVLNTEAHPLRRPSDSSAQS
ncbi:glycoside hydrolase family 47 protein [Xylariaceae sp. FL0804]|nr:glycoside hydrolase family 47 protein [Xylariaceae sp. FL0804]